MTPTIWWSGKRKSRKIIKRPVVKSQNPLLNFAIHLNQFFKIKVWNQIVGMVAWLFECTKTHWIVLCKRVASVVCQLHLNKAVIKIKKKLLEQKSKSNTLNDLALFPPLYLFFSLDCALAPLTSLIILKTIYTHVLCIFCSLALECFSLSHPQIFFWIWFEALLNVILSCSL